MKFYGIRRGNNSNGVIFNILPGRRHTEPLGDDGYPVGRKASRTLHGASVQLNGRLVEVKRMFQQLNSQLVPVMMPGAKPEFTPVYAGKDFCMALLDDNPSKDGIRAVSSPPDVYDKKQMEIYAGSATRQAWNYSDYYGEKIGSAAWTMETGFFCDEWGICFDIPAGGTVEKIIWAPFCVFYGIRGHGLSGTKIHTYKALHGRILYEFDDPTTLEHELSDGSFAIMNTIDAAVRYRYKIVANHYSNAPGTYAIRYVRDETEHAELEEIVKYKDGSLEERWRQAQHWLEGDYT